MKTNKVIFGFSKKEVIQISFLFILLFFAYSYLTFLAKGDMSDHACFAREALEGKMNYFGNFILYILINFFSFCLSIFSSLLSLPTISKISLSFLLAAATTYKFCWTYKNIPQYSGEWKRFLIALSMIFIVAIPIPTIFVTGCWYIGNFTPNVWHNSTTIFLFPFAIVLFAMSIKQLENFSNRRNLWLLLLVFLNIFVKPSYFFVWVCVYSLFLLIKYGLSSKFFKGLIPVIVGIVFLFIQYIWIYYFFPPTNDEASIIIKPFQSYIFYTPLYILPWALISSLLFPILYFVLNFKRLYKNSTFLFVFASFFVALIIFILLGETGPREKDLNFYWQIVPTAWLCFYISLVDYLKNKRQLKQNDSLKIKINNYLPAVVFAIHIITGVAYLGMYILTKNYV